MILCGLRRVGVQVGMKYQNQTATLYVAFPSYIIFCLGGQKAVKHYAI